MACPTCDHTMQKCTDNVYWCPRCGTLKSTLGYTVHEQPALVERCREFGATLGPSWKSLWHKLGIDEATSLPHERIS